MSSITSSRSTHQVKQLLDHSQSELDELFMVLPALKEGELSGVFQGTLMAVIGLGWLPRVFRVFLYRLLQTFINPWKGKRFDNNQGANIWFSRKGNILFGYFTISDNHKGSDSHLLTYLSYDVEKNFSFLRAVRGEVRQLDDRFYLARMNYLTSKRTLRVLYFTLEKQAD